MMEIDDCDYVDLECEDSILENSNCGGDGDDELENDSHLEEELKKKDVEVQTCSYLKEEFLWNKFVGTSPGVRLCSLCMEPFNPDTDHRIASLKCGHFFGENCIKYVFEQQKKMKRKSNQPEEEEKVAGQRCPVCGLTARKTDIKTIYSKIVMALDKTDEQLAQELLARENQLLTTAKDEKSRLQANVKFTSDQLLKVKILHGEVTSKLKRLKAKSLPYHIAQQQVTNHHHIDQKS